MKNKTLAIFMVAIMFASMGTVLAVKPADNGINEKGQVEHLYLFEKDPMTWDIMMYGSWGKMSYNEMKSTFVFNGHMLEEDVEYALIYYPDP